MPKMEDEVENTTRGRLKRNENVVIEPKNTVSNSADEAPAAQLKQLALSQLGASLKEGQASVAELLKILAIKEDAAAAGAQPLLPDEWRLRRE